jgi:hypothetical protein
VGDWGVGIGKNNIAWLHGCMVAWLHDCMDVGCGVLIAVSMITGEET